MVGLKIGHLTLYKHTLKEWIPIQCDTPLPIHYCGELIFVKLEGIAFTNGLEEMLACDELLGAVEMPSMIDLTEIPSNDNDPVYSSPCDRKEKGHAH